MANGINKVILIGRLGQDPELKYTASGDAVANLSLATSESWKDKNTGQQQEKTEWHRVVVYKRLAEIIGEYVRKGSQIYIEGKLTTRKWKDQSGQDRYTTEIIANQMQMLDSKTEGASGVGGSRPTSSAAGGQRAPAPPQSRQAPSSAYPDDFDDDIPF